jgi:prephenate dehydratase
MFGSMGDAAWAKGSDALELWETENRSGMLITLEDKAGALATTLGILSKHGISLTQI